MPIMGWTEKQRAKNDVRRRSSIIFCLYNLSPMDDVGSCQAGQLVAVICRDSSANHDFDTTGCMLNQFLDVAHIVENITTLS